MKKLPLNHHKHPGRGSHRAICDVCGCVFRARDLIVVTDKYNTQYGLLVCRKDADKTNPQAYPNKPRVERALDPRFVRPEQTDRYVFISTPDEIENPGVSGTVGRVAGVPRLLKIIGASASSVELQWQGPYDSGSAAVSGYLIERESPTGGGFSTVTTNTGATYYNDTSVSASTEYNYRIKAVNTAGTGSASNSAAITTN